MKAVRFYSKDEPLRIEQVDVPVIRRGCVIVRVQSAFVSPFIGDVLHGDHPMAFPPSPFTPGFDAIGVVEKVATDVVGLRAGETVYCNHAYETPGEFHSEDAIFIGNFGYEVNSPKLLNDWPDGAWAERVLLPSQCLVPLRGASRFEPSRLCRLGWLGTAYGALIRADIRPHHTVVINGATGLVGTSAVTLALALGVPRVVAVGRNQAILKTLKDLAPHRVALVSLRDIEEKNISKAIIDAAQGGAEIVIDAASAPSTSSAMAAFACLRRGGAMALISDSTLTLPIPYSVMVDRGIKIVGSSWFPQCTTPEIIGLIESGALDINLFEATTFPIEQINEAVKAAATSKRGLHHIAVVN